MDEKANARKARRAHQAGGVDNPKVVFNYSAIPVPEITDLEFGKWLQTRIEEVQSINTVKTDGKKGQEIEFTDELKAEMLPVVKLGLSIDADSNKGHMEAISAKGHFLNEVDRFLKAKKLRIFRTLCFWFGWKKSSAYNWLKLWRTYGSHLTEYANYSERQLLICSSHKDPMEFLEHRGAEIREADEAALRTMVNPDRVLAPSRIQRGTSKVVIGHVCYTRRKDKAIISGLNEKNHEELVALLTSWSSADLYDREEVSNVLDTQEDEPAADLSNNGNGLNDQDVIDEAVWPPESFRSETLPLMLLPS